MSNSPNLEKLTCPKCSTELDATDNFCRHCGAATQWGTVASASSDAVETVITHVVDERPPVRKKLSENRTFVLIMLFLALGPVAFPMLWRSRAFTGWQKVASTVAVTVLTIAGLWLVWYMWVYMVVEPFQELYYGVVVLQAGGIR